MREKKVHTHKTNIVRIYTLNQLILIVLPWPSHKNTHDGTQKNIHFYWTKRREREKKHNLECKSNKIPSNLSHKLPSIAIEEFEKRKKNTMKLNKTEYNVDKL